MQENFVLDAREIAEIRLAHIYRLQFNHGTPGHMHYLLISKLAERIDALEKELDTLRTDKDFMD